MESKRTVTVELLGQRITVRTTETEEALQRNLTRINQVLQTLRARTDGVEPVRLFALGLLHLGREIDVLERTQVDWMTRVTGEVEERIARARRTLDEV